ncbi:TPA_asm: Hemagglutinin glycoprotein [Raton olivaceo morbillivirus]|uniref:Hemagglutinin glycoprotein n=1 Tax=Raton olivaceo morbillivirus TaxID=2928189 RepID=A0A9N6YK33_9MONO|nr:TPA_asm: Hemagglutinin glycoprotein [Raton olivaceo morbillivirus]
MESPSNTYYKQPDIATISYINSLGGGTREEMRNSKGNQNWTFYVGLIACGLVIVAISLSGHSLYLINNMGSDLQSINNRVVIDFSAIKATISQEILPTLTTISNSFGLSLSRGLSELRQSIITLSIQNSDSIQKFANDVRTFLEKFKRNVLAMNITDSPDFETADQPVTVPYYTNVDYYMLWDRGLSPCPQPVSPKTNSYQFADAEIGLSANSPARVCQEAPVLALGVNTYALSFTISDFPCGPAAPTMHYIEVGILTEKRLGVPHLTRRASKVFGPKPARTSCSIVLINNGALFICNRKHTLSSNPGVVDKTLEILNLHQNGEFKNLTFKLSDQQWDITVKDIVMAGGSGFIFQEIVYVPVLIAQVPNKNTHFNCTGYYKGCSSTSQDTCDEAGKLVNNPDGSIMMGILSLKMNGQLLRNSSVYIVPPNLYPYGKNFDLYFSNTDKTIWVITDNGGWDGVSTVIQFGLVNNQVKFRDMITGLNTPFSRGCRHALHCPKSCTYGEGMIPFVISKIGENLFITGVHENIEGNSRSMLLTTLYPGKYNLTQQIFDLSTRLHRGTTKCTLVSGVLWCVVLMETRLLRTNTSPMQIAYLVYRVEYEC